MMKVAYRLQGLIIALSLCLLACDDDNENPASDGLELYLQFADDARGPFTPINFYIYKTKEDYTNSTNVYISGKTDLSKGKYFIPAAQLEKNKEYYIDWYSDDYGFNSWAPTSPSFAVRTLVYTGGYQNAGVSALGEIPDGKARMVFLNGNDAETNWKATGVLGQDSWNDIPEYEKYIRIKLRKDGTGIYVTKNANGQEVITAFTFEPKFQISMVKPDNNQALVGILALTEQAGTINLAPAVGLHQYVLTRE